MYNSGVTLSDIITELSGEVDIAGSIPDSAYIRWVNTLEQLIYTDILGFYGRQNVTLAGGGFALSSITSGTGEDSCRYDDIVKVYGDGREYVRAGVISSVIFDGDKGIYWQDGDSVKVSPIVEPDTVTVIRRIRPAIKTTTAGMVMLPYEWLELVMSKLRGEAYKIANDDGQAAKWLEDYNAQLSSFTEWARKRQERYGE